MENGKLFQITSEHVGESEIVEGYMREFVHLVK